MPQGYSDEELFRAAKAADAAGDTEAARKLTQALLAGKTQDQIETLAANLRQTIDKQALAQNIASRDAGGPTNQFVAPPRNPVEETAKQAVNTGVGYLQGAAEAAIDVPLDIASGVQSGANALLDATIGGGLDALGMTGAADWWRNTGAQEEAIRSGRARAGDVIGDAMPAPEGYETQRDVARFAGGFLVPGGPAARGPQAVQQTTQRAVRNALAPRAAPSDAAQIVAEGQRRGVPVFTTDVKPPRSGMGRMVKQTIPEKIPLAGMSGPRQAQQEARQGAVRQIVEEFGGDTGRALFDDTVSPAEEVSKILTQQRSQRITNLKAAKDSVIDGVSVPFETAPNTVRAIQEQVRKLQEIDPEEFAPVIERLQRFGERVTSGGSLRAVEEQRRLLGELFQDPNLARIKTRGQQAINAIYDPLRRDMGDFIEAQAGSAARAKWAKANEELSAMAGELKSARFRNVLGSADTTPEAVGRILFSGTADVSDMRRLVSNLDRNGLRKVQGAILARAFDNAGGAQGVSVERFLGNLNRFKEQIGVAFKGEDRQAIEGLRRLLEATRRGADAGANVRNGEQNLPTILGIGATQALGVAGGVASLGVGGLLARVYESAPARNLLIRLSKSQPGSARERESLNLIMRSTAPIVNTWRDNVARAVNDNPSGLLAAEEQPNEPQ